jgi:hypothetical protein
VDADGVNSLRGKNTNTVKEYIEVLLVVRKEFGLEVKKENINCKFSSQIQCKKKITT